MHKHWLLDWFTHTTLFNISMDSWALSALLALASYLAMALLLGWGARRLIQVAGRTSTQVDDVAVEVLAGTRHWLLGIVAVLIGFGMLDVPDRWAGRIGQLWFVALALQLALWCNAAITVGLRRQAERSAHAGAVRMGASATLLSWGLRTVLWSVLALAVISNLGVNITAFVASLGVGGIAVALAVQNILGDLFASLAIALDKPFEVGDAIAVGNVSGTVEQVGLKTTRIRASGGEQIVMSNTDLLKSVVSNYKRLAERRVVFKFSLGHETTPEQAADIPAALEKILCAEPRLRFDRAHLQGLTDGALNYEVVYVVLDANYKLHMDLQQMLILTLMRELRERGIRLARPVSNIVLSDGGGRDGGAGGGRLQLAGRTG